MIKEKRKQILLYLATKLSWLLVLAFGKMARIRVKGAGYWRSLVNSKRGFIYLLWHGKMLMPVYFHRRRNILAMVSEHGDGEIIAQAILRLGYRTARGSSTRGGQKAFRALLREVKNGAECTILPDGPQGPRHELKMGAIVLAQMAGVPILPLTFAAQRPIVFRSWDRFTMWWPFSKVYVLYGKPITIPRKLTPSQLEEHRLTVEQQLLALEKEADDIFRK
jgi:lysophospholipid acyltransferase (LPLAT)-like uncharacterized protein